MDGQCTTCTLFHVRLFLVSLSWYWLKITDVLGRGGRSDVVKSRLVDVVDDDERWGDIYEDMPAKRKLALYDYDPAELSPNVDAEVELSFRTGDLLLVYGDMDDDGFYMGELNGRRGLVPSNFLTDVPPGYMTSPPATLATFINGSSTSSSSRNTASAITNSQGGAVSKNQPRVLGQRRW